MKSGYGICLSLTLSLVSSLLCASGPIKFDQTATVLGVDANKNKLRDDVEQYILNTYQIPNQRAAVSQFAKAFYVSLSVDTSNKLLVRNSSREKSRSIGCIYRHFPSGKNPAAALVTKEIRNLMTNTRQRRQADRAFSKAMDGMSIMLPTEDLCDFEK